MLINTWSIALLVCAVAALFMACGVLPTALKVLRFWDGQADTAFQIELEQQTWLSAVLIQYLLIIQIVSLLLLVLAADSFSQTLVGAMCAAGAFLANEYGLAALIIKICGVFLYGFWIVLHRLDQGSEYSPLVRIKYFYFLGVFPFLLADCYFLFFYLLNLQPEIITSCCGVIFSASDSDGKNLIAALENDSLLYLFYATAVITALFTLSLAKPGDKNRFKVIQGVVGSALWGFFFGIALLAITGVFSSYIYAMPSHRCPFDILQKEYYSIGYPIYLSLFIAVFAGGSSGLARLFQTMPGLAQAVARYQRVAGRLALVMLVIFLAIVSYYPLAYHLAGGET